MQRPSLSRPADGFLDLGRLGLVLEPLIQDMACTAKNDITRNFSKYAGA